MTTTARYGDLTAAEAKRERCREKLLRIYHRLIAEGRPSKAKLIGYRWDMVAVKWPR